MERVREPEMMDDPNVDPDSLRRSLGFIRKINKRLGGQRAMIGHLQRWSRSWPSDRPVTILDIGTGSADLPAAASRWAARTGKRVQITAVDNHARTLECAREFLDGASIESDQVELIQADALALTEVFSPNQFDYVHAGLFLHHLSEIEVMTVLRMMERLSRVGIIWNDLVRSRVALAGITALTVGQPEIVRHDSTVSVRAGFTRREVLDIRHRLSLSWTRYRSSILTQRFTLAGERPGSWK